MSGNDGWDDDGGWDDEDDLSWDDGWEDEEGADGSGAGDGAGGDEPPAEPRPRRTLVATPIVSTPEPLPREDPYDNSYRDDYDDGPARSSRAWAIVAVLLLLIGAGVALALVLSSDDDKGENASDVDTDASSTTQTTFNLGLPGGTGSSTSTSLGTATTGLGAGAGGAGTSSTTSTTVKSTTSTTKVEDTNDPACSEPGTSPAAGSNQPARIAFCIDDGSPKVGQAVKISGTASDPDSQVEPQCIVVFYDNDPPPTCTPGVSPAEPVTNREFSTTHTFTTPGTHTIHVSVASDSPVEKQSVATTLLKITVHA